MLIEAHHEVDPPLILVGGTGLYFKTLTQGLSPIPDIHKDVRKHWRALSQEMPAEALHAILAGKDAAVAAKLRPSDIQRIVRALEVIESTGRSLLWWQQQKAPPLLAKDSFAGYILDIEPILLKDRIASRTHLMLQNGAIEEVRKLLQRNLSEDLPVMRAIGVPQLRSYITEDATLKEVEAEITLATQRYAKRQRTFFRHQLKGWSIVCEEQIADFSLEA